MALAQAGGCDQAAPASAAREQDAVHEARRRLLADLRQARRAALARELGLNTRKLDLAFKRAFGLSMARCLQEERLLRGRELIPSGGLSVSEAAWHGLCAGAFFRGVPAAFRPQPQRLALGRRYPRAAYPGLTEAAREI